MTHSLRDAFSLRQNLRRLVVPPPGHLSPLDGLRALSILWVVLFHAGWYSRFSLPAVTFLPLIGARWMLPFWRGDFWKGVLHEIRWYAFLEKYPKQYVGHNPLAHLMMFFVFTLGTFFMIITGFALYSEGAGRDSWQYKLFGWVFSIFPNSQDVHTYHHLGMWVLVCFTVLHIYAAVREDIMSRQSMISSMISGERQFRDEDV